MYGGLIKNFGSEGRGLLERGGLIERKGLKRASTVTVLKSKSGFGVINDQMQDHNIINYAIHNFNASLSLLFEITHSKKKFFKFSSKIDLNKSARLEQPPVI